ncbi:MAG: hypothetical protein FD159_489 [Syntrophaceae bacterium]|nr:MAG: hypothetical protein FD159_489 [Syntrophaceae bacterium]
MAIVSEQNRKILKNMKKEDVKNAMDLFDQKFRKDFEKTRWKKYSLLHNGQSYPPKDLLRCVIAGMTNSLYDRDSVIGGGPSINKYFINLGFTVENNEKPSVNVSKPNLYARQEPTSTPPAGEIPTREEIKKILGEIAPEGREVDEDSLKSRIEVTFKLKNRMLMPDWWEITKKNLLDWSNKDRKDKE